MLHHLLLTTALATTLSSAHCTRPLLQDVVTAYRTAQTNGQPSPLTTYFTNATYQNYYENAQPLNLSSSLLATPLPITHHRSLYDTTACATFTELVVNSTTTPYVIGTQLRLAANHKITKVDSIVTKPGDWLFNITGYAYWVERENWDPIPLAQRDSRDTIRSAADAYLDVFSNPNATVPWGTPCVRLEGGLYGDPGVNGSCEGGVPEGVPMRERRYVMDEVVGSVDVLLAFGESGWPDSHQFRVEGGRLRYVHTMTHCGVANCGL